MHKLPLLVLYRRWHYRSDSRVRSQAGVGGVKMNDEGADCTTMATA
jgi:hypothetical protein